MSCVWEERPVAVPRHHGAVLVGTLQSREFVLAFYPAFEKLRGSTWDTASHLPEVSPETHQLLLEGV